jgi:hypothetical protein
VNWLTMSDRRDRGCINGASRSARAGLRLGLVKKACPIALTALITGHRQNPHDFAEHPPVHQEWQRSEALRQMAARAEIVSTQQKHRITNRRVGPKGRSEGPPEDELLIPPFFAVK